MYKLALLALLSLVTTIPALACDDHDINIGYNIHRRPFGLYVLGPDGGTQLYATFHTMSQCEAERSNSGGDNCHIIPPADLRIEPRK